MEEQEKKQPKTWEEAVKELGQFIKKSKEEEQKQEQED